MEGTGAACKASGRVTSAGVRGRPTFVSADRVASVLTGLVLTSLLPVATRFTEPDLAAEPKLTATANRHIKSENTPSRASTLVEGTLLLRRTDTGDFRPLIKHLPFIFTGRTTLYAPLIAPPKRAVVTYAARHRSRAPGQEHFGSQKPIASHVRRICLPIAENVGV